VNNLIKENPNAVLVESGNLSLQADRVGLVMSVLSQLHYDAVGVGDHDLRECKDQFFAEAAKNKIVVLDTRPSAPESTRPYVIKNVDGVKVGIVSFGAVLPEDASANEYERRKAMYKAYRAAREASDVLIVLDQGNVISSDWLDRNGRRLGAPDLVVSGIQQNGLGEPEVWGKTRILPTGVQGKQLGVVDLEIAAGMDVKVTWNRVQLDEGVVEDEKTRQMVAEFMRNPAANQAPTPTVPGTQMTERSARDLYYSPELCKTCHIREYQDWAKTKHAAAIKTLIDAKRMIPECIACHSEEYRRLKTVAIPEDNVGGVECATCHMESLPHDIERRNVTTRVKVNPMVCLDCHTKERSPKYDMQAYFPRVAHPGALSDKSASAGRQ
jgi:hypothetical protein